MLSLFALALALAAPTNADAAVVVGISDYDALPAIPGAADVATGWFSFLTTKRGIPGEHVHLLRDGQATREEVQAAIAAATTQVKAGGTLWFVFIGHGAPDLSSGDGLLLGADTRAKETSVTSRGLSRGAIVSALQRGKQKRTLVVLDACFSGLTPDGSNELVPQMMATIPLKRLTTTTTMTVLSSSSTAAGPLPGRREPAFSSLLLGAMRGWGDSNNDAVVDVDEAFAFADQRLVDLVRDRDQRPSRSGPSFVLAVNATERAPSFNTVVAARDEAPAPAPATPAPAPAKADAVEDRVRYTFTGQTSNPIDPQVTGVVTTTSLRFQSGLGFLKEDLPLRTIASAEAVFGLGILAQPVKIILNSGRAIDFYVADRERFLRELAAARAAASKR
jgi:hypothetical protein